MTPEPPHPEINFGELPEECEMLVVGKGVYPEPPPSPEDGLRAEIDQLTQELNARRRELASRPAERSLLAEAGRFVDATDLRDRVRDLPDVITDLELRLGNLEIQLLAIEAEQAKARIAPLGKEVIRLEAEKKRAEEAEKIARFAWIDAQNEATELRRELNSRRDAHELLKAKLKRGVR